MGKVRVEQFGVDASDGGLGLIQCMKRPEVYGYMLVVTGEVLYDPRVDWYIHAVETFENRIVQYGKMILGDVQVQPIANWRYENDNSTHGFHVFATVVDAPRSIETEGHIAA